MNWSAQVCPCLFVLMASFSKHWFLYVCMGLLVDFYCQPGLHLISLSTAAIHLGSQAMRRTPLLCFSWKRMFLARERCSKGLGSGWKSQFCVAWTASRCLIPGSTKVPAYTHSLGKEAVCAGKVQPAVEKQPPLCCGDGKIREWRGCELAERAEKFNVCYCKWNICPADTNPSGLCTQVISQADNCWVSFASKAYCKGWCTKNSGAGMLVSHASAEAHKKHRIQHCTYLRFHSLFSGIKLKRLNS